MLALIAFAMPLHGRIERIERRRESLHRRIESAFVAHGPFLIPLIPGWTMTLSLGIVKKPRNRKYLRSKAYVPCDHRVNRGGPLAPAIYPACAWGDGAARAALDSRPLRANPPPPQNRAQSYNEWISFVGRSRETVRGPRPA
jgi:hypothetical protein